MISQYLPLHIYFKTSINYSLFFLMRFKLKASLKSWAEAHNTYIYIKNEYHEHIHINYLCYSMSSSCIHTCNEEIHTLKPCSGMVELLLKRRAIQ